MNASRDSIRSHFRGADALYRAWSTDRTMHHGFWSPTRPAERSIMLRRLTDEVLDRLHCHAPGHLADLGCGFGTSAERATRRGHRVDGFTICPEQAEWASRTAHPRLRFHAQDYRQTGLPSASCDGAYAIESACYASGDSKHDLIEEVWRILRPGARFVVTDGFIHRRPGPWLQRQVDGLASGWAVERFPQRAAFLQALTDAGFEDIRIEDWSLRVAPSVLQGQWLLAQTFWRHRGTLSPVELAHLRSARLGLVVGLARRHFRYLMVSAKRP